MSLSFIQIRLFKWILPLLKRYGLERVARYGIVGVFAASTHAGTALAVRHLAHFPQVLSNFSGFLAGAVISYLGSYYFTFQSSEGHKRSLPRFALVWVIGIAVNVGLFGALKKLYDTPFLLNVFIAIVVTPIAQYAMLRFWAFKDSVN